MRPYRTRAILLFLLCLAVSGCLGKLGESTPPDYYQPAYRFVPSSCPDRFPDAVQVWPFSASAPYDRDQLIVAGPSQTVKFSSKYRWVAMPGNMLADWLIRDLSQSGLFADAVAVGSPADAGRSITGQVYKFSLEDSRAVLEVEIAFLSEKPKREVLFRKNYSFRSEPLASFGPSQFAEAMSDLIGKASVEFRQDLCAFLQRSDDGRRRTKDG